MQNKRYKKLQHKINRSIRNLNENIANDDLWKGRFVAIQDDIRFSTYEDRSGVCAFVFVRLMDLETGVVMCKWLTHYEIIGLSFWYNKFNKGCGYPLFQFMNDFVCEETKGLIFKEYRKTSIDYTRDKRWSK